MRAFFFIVAFVLSWVYGITLLAQRYDANPSGFFLPDEPRERPGIMASGFISTGLDELSGVFMPDFKEFYYAVTHRNEFSALLYTRYEGGIWRYPEVVGFSGIFPDADPFLSPCGEVLYFSSQRPTSGQHPGGIWNIWLVERDGKGWGEPRVLTMDPLRHERFPSVNNRGDLYFYADYGSSLVTFDFQKANIYMAEKTETGYLPAEKLPATVNSEYADYTPLIAPDGSFLILASMRPGGRGQSDLYICYWQEEGGHWSAAENMGSLINSSDSDHYPLLTPDGKFLLFSSDRRILSPKPAEGANYSYFKRVGLGPGNGFNDIWFIKAPEK
jgi:Tol biopolymer transport system component